MQDGVSGQNQKVPAPSLGGQRVWATRRPRLWVLLCGSSSSVFGIKTIKVERKEEAVLPLGWKRRILTILTG